MYFTLPDVIDPATRHCVPVPVPDDRFHIAAFWEALSRLAKSYNWERNEDHTAADVARVWDGIIDGIRDSINDGLGCAEGDICASALLYYDVIPGVTIGYGNPHNEWYHNSCRNECENSYPFIVWGWAWQEPLEVGCETSFIFVDTDYNLVGTNVCELRAERLGSLAATYTLKWQSCDNFIHTEVINDPPANGVFKAGFEAKWVWLTCNRPFSYAVTWDGPILCGPA